MAGVGFPNYTLLVVLSHGKNWPEVECDIVRSRWQLKRELRGRNGVRGGRGGKGRRQVREAKDGHFWPVADARLLDKLKNDAEDTQVNVL